MSTASVSCEVGSLGCPSWLVLCGPTCSSCVLGFSGVSVAPFCRLSLWSHPLLMLFLAWVFFLWRLFGLGLVGCSPAWVPAPFWGNSPSLVLVFAWWFLQFGCPGSWSFLGIFAWVLSSRFQCADSLWWLRMVLGYPPSVAWRLRLLPWFSVRYLLACPRGAAVPLDSSVLRCSWSSRWGHLSQVGTVFFLSPRS